MSWSIIDAYTMSFLNWRYSATIGERPILIDEASPNSIDPLTIIKSNQCKGYF
jgi:hypothetical protein